MNNKMHKLLAIGLLFSSSAAMATAQVGLQFNNLDISEYGSSPSLNSGVLTAGYQINLTDTLTITPQLGYGIGLGTKYHVIEFQTAQNYGEVGYELKHQIKFAAKLGYRLNASSEIYFAPLVNRIKYTKQTLIYPELQQSLSDSMESFEKTKYGAGVGFQFEFAPKHQFELGLELYEGLNTYLAGYQFNF